MAVFSFICKPVPLLPGSPLSVISSQLTGTAARVTLPFPPTAPSPALATRWRGVPAGDASAGALYQGCPPSRRGVPSCGTPGARGAAGRDTDRARPGGPRVVPGAGPRGGGEGSVGGAGPRGGGAGAGRAHVTAAPLAGAGRGGAAGQRREAAGTAGRSVRCRCCCCCCSAAGTGGSGSGAGSGAGGAGPGMHNARPDELGADRVSAAAGTGRERDGTTAPAPRRPGTAGLP